MKNANEGAAWLTKAEALRQLGVSERSLDRMVTAGKIQKQTRPRPGKTPEPMFNRADVDRESAVDAFAMPAEDGGKHLAQRSAASLPHPAEPLAALAPLLAAFLQTRAAPPAMPAPQWVGVDSAAEYSGLSTRLIQRLIRSARLPALRDGQTWKIHRDDLDALRAPQPSDRAKRATPPRVAQSAKNGGRP